MLKLAVQISTLCGRLSKFVLQTPTAMKHGNMAQVSKKEAQVNPALGTTCIKYVRVVLSF